LKNQWLRGVRVRESLIKLAHHLDLRKAKTASESFGEVQREFPHQFFSIFRPLLPRLLVFHKPPGYDRDCFEYWTSGSGFAPEIQTIRNFRHPLSEEQQ
jgi:hypothetical protein